MLSILKALVLIAVSSLMYSVGYVTLNLGVFVSFFKYCVHKVTMVELPLFLSVLPKDYFTSELWDMEVY